METEKTTISHTPQSHASCKMCGTKQSYKELHERWLKTAPQGHLRVLCGCGYKYGVNCELNGDFTSFEFDKYKNMPPELFVKPVDNDLKTEIGIVKSVTYIRTDKTDFGKRKAYRYELEELDGYLEARHITNPIPVGVTVLFTLKFINDHNIPVGAMCRHITPKTDIVKTDIVKTAVEEKVDPVEEKVSEQIETASTPTDKAKDEVAKEIKPIVNRTLKVVALKAASLLYGSTKSKDVIDAADAYYAWLINSNPFD